MDRSALAVFDGCGADVRIGWLSAAEATASLVVTPVNDAPMAPGGTVRAKENAAALGLNVVLLMSDKQDAFVTCIADEFRDVPHQFCVNHFCRDLAKPILAMDSTAKKKMLANIR